LRDKISHYLQQHLVGEVMTSKDALDYFSTDGSVFTIRPKVIVYPRNTNDVRKVARFTWQLAERGHIIPTTARGKGTDWSGAAIGEGVILVFPAHMNKILELDKDHVVVQPGAIYAKVEQSLHTHYRFLPPYPASLEYSTIGGAVANNSAGEKSFKYSDTRKYTKSLNVVLANGELIETGKLTKRELSKKKGLTTHEGLVYRKLDGLLDDNKHLIEKMKEIKVSKNTAGYALDKIKDKGTFDLTPLFVGSQGTLGIITQASLGTEPFNPNTTLGVGLFKALDNVTEAIKKIAELGPSMIEVVDENLLNFTHENQPSQLPDIVTKPFPKLAVLIEFDDANTANQRKKSKKLSKIFDEYCYEYQTTADEHEKDSLWKIRHSSAVVIWQTVGNSKAVPGVDDGIVPLDKLTEYIEKSYDLFKKHKLSIAIWGHGGDANLHMKPFLDLSSIGDRQRLFKLADDYYDMIIKLGGSTSGQHNDGRIRGPYLEKMYGKETYNLFVEVKKIFDPFGTMNPGVKVGVDKKGLMGIMRKSYSVNHLYDHMPRT